MGAHTTLVSQEERQQLGVVVKEEHSEQYKSWKQVRAHYIADYVVSLYLMFSQFLHRSRIKQSRITSSFLRRQLFTGSLRMPNMKSIINSAKRSSEKSLRTK